MLQQDVPLVPTFTEYQSSAAGKHRPETPARTDDLLGPDKTPSERISIDASWRSERRDDWPLHR
jgi:hypothetical protein